jgi:hypothetical protein
MVMKVSVSGTKRMQMKFMLKTCSATVLGETRKCLDWPQDYTSVVSSELINYMEIEENLQNHMMLI